MRIFFKLAMKLLTMVVMAVLMGSAVRLGRPYLMKAMGMPEGMPGMGGMGGVESVATAAGGGAHFSSEESDLMGTVFKSAIRLFTGQAKKDELASELSDKLYANRGDAATMAELGIELVKPGGPSPLGGVGKPGAATEVLLKPGAAPAATPAGAVAGTTPPAKPGEPAVAASTQPRAGRAKPDVKPAGTLATGASPKGPATPVAQLWGRAKRFSVELTMIPLVFTGMMVYSRLRRRRSPEDAFGIPLVAIQAPSESEPFEIKHPVDRLGAEEFELLVALIYQRQGYRVSMPAGLSGGRGGDFTLLRKSERILVQCKRLSLDHKVPMERVRELHDAVAEAGATRGMYVASCGFSWDARNYAKSKGVTLINARTLDEWVAVERGKSEEDLLAVAQWAPKLMGKVQLTPPVCPACEAAMEQHNLSSGLVWLCSQRPECRGRRLARKYNKPAPAPAASQPSETPAAFSSPVESSAAAPTKPPVDAPAKTVARMRTTLVPGRGEPPERLSWRQRNPPAPARSTPSQN